MGQLLDAATAPLTSPPNGNPPTSVDANGRGQEGLERTAATVAMLVSLLTWRLGRFAELNAALWAAAAGRRRPAEAATRSVCICRHTPVMVQLLAADFEAARCTGASPSAASSTQPPASAGTQQTGWQDAVGELVVLLLSASRIVKLRASKELGDAGTREAPSDQEQLEGGSDGISSGGERQLATTLEEMQYLITPCAAEAVAHSDAAAACCSAVEDSADIDSSKDKDPGPSSERMSPRETAESNHSSVEKPPHAADGEPAACQRPSSAAGTSEQRDAVLGPVVVWASEADACFSSSVLESCLSCLSAISQREDRGAGVCGGVSAVVALQQLGAVPALLGMLATLEPIIKPGKARRQQEPTTSGCGPSAPEAVPPSPAAASPAVLKDFPHKNPYQGYRGDLLAVLASMSYR